MVSFIFYYIILRIASYIEMHFAIGLSSFHKFNHASIWLCKVLGNMKKDPLSLMLSTVVKNLRGLGYMIKVISGNFKL